VTRYDQIVATARSADQLRTDFAEALAVTCHEDGTMHRLWYDLRNQALFEESFREDVLEIDQTLELMIWRIVSTYAELSGRPITVSASTAYALFDGLFQQALLRHLSGQPNALQDLREGVDRILPKLLVP
jgi:hypothetical protein